MGMMLFYLGAALLALTLVTAVVFRVRPLRYTPFGSGDQGTVGEHSQSAAATQPMERAGETVPMDAPPAEAAPAGATVPMDQEMAGAAAPPAGATVPMEQTPHSESRDEKGKTLTE